MLRFQGRWLLIQGKKSTRRGVFLQAEDRPEQQRHRLRRLPYPDPMLKYEKWFLTAEILGWFTLVVGGGSAAVVVFGAPSSPVLLKVALAGLLLLWLLLKLRGTLTFRHQRRIRAQQRAVAQEASGVDNHARPT